MSKRKTKTPGATVSCLRWLVLGCLGAGVSLLTAGPAVAAPPTPAWGVVATSQPTNFTPAEPASYLITITNVGNGPTDGSEVTVTDTLPNGLTPTVCAVRSTQVCTISGQTVTWTIGRVFGPGELENLTTLVEVSPTAGGTVANTVAVGGGGASPVTITEPTTIGSTDAPFGIADFGFPAIFPDGTPDTQAGGHPYSLTTNIVYNTIGSTEPNAFVNPSKVPEEVKDLRVDPPLGLIGNPQAIPMCTQDEFREHTCPASSQIGVSAIALSGGNTSGGAIGPQSTAVYNMVPPPGVPAQFAFNYNVGAINVRTRLNAQVHSGGDYGLTVVTSGISQLVPLLETPVTLWGVPADPSHDDQRCTEIAGGVGRCIGPPGTDQGPSPYTAPPKPFLTMPTACPGTPLRSSAEADSWQEAGSFTRVEATQPALEGCASLDFSPTLKARPTTDVADSPSGLSVDLHLPAHEGCEEEAGGEFVCENAEAELKTAKVTLPEGLVINPAGANGLEGCSAAQIGYKAGTSHPAEFSPGPAECPDSSRIGSVKIKTQLLDHPLPGSVYLAKPYDNPFGSLLAIYVAVYDPASGVVVKLPGRVETDPQTGQLTTTFEENPQLPFEDFELEFFKGATAPLMTPPACGSYATSSSLASWAGQSASPGDKYAIDRSPLGGTCATSAAALPNSPSFSAGTVTPIAGAYSPFVLNLSREDGSQRLSVIETTLPEGLLGRLAGVAECPQAAIAAAAAKSGREEQAIPSCPPGSEVGSVVVGAGAGPAPYFVSGKVYLAGPYEGAPLSFVVITPAVAGPFDLGTVVTRVALQVDPLTAQITAKSDPLPSVLKAGGDGFPLDIRSIALKVDRPSFTLNPTSCDPLAVNGSLLSTTGQAAALTDRFQVAECGRLGFKPSLSLQLTGKTNRGANPALKATLTMPPSNQANIARAAVTLPHSEFLDQGHIKNVCTQVQFKGAGCPKSSVLGYAKAITPLLAQPLEGPVYLMSGFGHKLPDLAADLKGQISVLLHGKVDTGSTGGIRNTFEVVPDAPVTKFVLSLQGGSRGLLQNSENICAKTQRAIAEFTGQNGKVADLKPVLRNSKCGKPAKKHGKRH